MCVILQCFLELPSNIFYRKIHIKNSYKVHINCNNNNKKARNMIYLKKIMFSYAKKLVIKKAAAGIIKFRNVSCQKLEIFEHLHPHNNDLQRTSEEYYISETKTVMPHNFDLNNST